MSWPGLRRIVCWQACLLLEFVRDLEGRARNGQASPQIRAHSLENPLMRCGFSAISDTL